MFFPVKEKLKSGKSGSNRRTRRGKRISVLYLLPSVIGVLLFFVLPFLIVVYYSVVDNPINHEFVFLDNFIMVSHNAAFQQAAKNTMMFSATAVNASFFDKVSKEKPVNLVPVDQLKKRLNLLKK